MGDQGGVRVESNKAFRSALRASQLGAEAIAEALGPWSTRKFSRGTWGHFAGFPGTSPGSFEGRAPERNAVPPN